ncbi:hypothetical protein [Falsihalocynthiibacter sp. CO-5D18]|uniref:hypothetical protein n=1 Tax=Falsihalocynthiibacter sp. CO-5D18 TaxID=3240872 RepID=UPI00350FF20C
MATRRTKSDTTTGKMQAARAPDLSAAVAPTDLANYEFLNESGRATYNQYYKTRAEWSTADLSLILQAALVQQLIAQLYRSVSPPDCFVTIHPRTGNTKINPVVGEISRQRSLLAGLLRDASLRTRDNHTGNNVPKAAQHIASPTADAPPPQSFDNWLESEMGKPN